MIRGLGHHLSARRAQLLLFHQHLRAQYSDRMLYWEARGLARLQGHTICIIADGMDQSKWDLPRSRILKGKDFSNMQRVKMHVTGCIAHGHCCMVAVSAPDTKKDGNASVEILAHMLTHLKQKGIPLSQSHLVLQHDNTCREFKNHSGLRFCASQVSSKNLMGVTCSFLRTGHTHEDIDQMFSRMSKHLQRVPVLQTPDDVCNTINDFLQEAHMPHEKDRRVTRMDTVRDWWLRHCIECLCLPSVAVNF